MIPCTRLLQFSYYFFNNFIICRENHSSPPITYCLRPH
nr:MAG TPA: hypothetical protein [Caudoviricetes sp.]